MKKKLAFTSWLVDTSMGGPGRSQPAELPRIYGWFRISDLKTQNYWLLGLGGLVCCCVDWAAWSPFVGGIKEFLLKEFKEITI